MTWLRGLVAVMAGFGFMMFSAFVASGLSALVGKLIVGALGAFLAGWMVARLASTAPFHHAVVLAAVVAAASIPPIVAGWPAGWYPMTVAIVGVLGVLAGGWIRAAAERARGTVEGRS